MKMRLLFAGLALAAFSAPVAPARAQDGEAYSNRAVPVNCRIDGQRVLRDCVIEDRTGLSVDRQRVVLSRFEGRALDEREGGGLGPGQVYRSRYCDCAPFQGVRAQDRVEYSGPPVIAAPSPSAPPPAPSRPPVITNPQWAAVPDAADLERFYPSLARDKEISGRATIECTVKADGTMSACVVVSESPPGYGFGVATIRAAAAFRMRTRMVSGEPVKGQRVRVTLVWNLG